ncbi:type VI secretion system protein TssA [Enterobacteriaceae bacterium LUAb1]
MMTITKPRPLNVLQQLIDRCLPGQDALALGQEQAALWDKWLQPICAAQATGEDPGYDDDFQCIREEVNRLSGADSELIIERAEKLLLTTCKDLRVASYYLWARLQRDGESGLADGLTLIAALLVRFGTQLWPQRATTRLGALAWLTGTKVLDGLLRWPEVVRSEAARTAAALALLQQGMASLPEAERPSLHPLYSALESRLAQSGGLDTIVPQNSHSQPENTRHEDAGLQTGAIQSGRELMERGREMSHWLQEQPQGWLAAFGLMKCLRWHTLHILPFVDASGLTPLNPPRQGSREQLKRLWMQQNWHGLLDLIGDLFSEGVNHFWLDLQWYACQALENLGPPCDRWGETMKGDLEMLLRRLPGLENLAWHDGTPFADEVTRNWISQQVIRTEADWHTLPPAATSANEEDILSYESEAIAQADSDGVESALNWLAARPAIHTPRQRWLLRLVMARVAEQYGRHEVALHVLRELDTTASTLTLLQWEPTLLFEVQARCLKLLRMKAQRNDADKSHLSREMDRLLASLIALDPARAAVLCG